MAVITIASTPSHVLLGEAVGTNEFFLKPKFINDSKERERERKDEVILKRINKKIKKKKIKKKREKRKGLPGLKERQRRVVGPMDENHEVKIIIEKSEKYMGNVEVRITKSAFVVYTSTWLFYFIFLKKYLVNLIKKKKKKSTWLSC